MSRGGRGRGRLMRFFRACRSLSVPNMYLVDSAYSCIKHAHRMFHYSISFRPAKRHAGGKAHFIPPLTRSPATFGNCR